MNKEIDERNSKAILIEMKDGKGRTVERDPEEAVRAKVYLRAREEEYLRSAARDAGLTNQYGEGNLSQILYVLSMTRYDALVDMLKELSEGIL